jgi:hypothetical protein
MRCATSSLLIRRTFLVVRSGYEPINFRTLGLQEFKRFI